MRITFPISYPISKLLDYILGVQVKNRFQNTDLKVLIELHTHNALQKYGNTEDEKRIENKENNNLREDIGLNEEQANLMISAIEMNQKHVFQKMISIDKVYMINYNHKISDVKDLDKKGFSRVPVFENNKDNIVGENYCY